MGANLQLRGWKKRSQGSAACSVTSVGTTVGVVVFQSTRSSDARHNAASDGMKSLTTQGHQISQNMLFIMFHRNSKGSKPTPKTHLGGGWFILVGTMRGGGIHLLLVGTQHGDHITRRADAAHSVLLKAV